MKTLKLWARYIGLLIVAAVAVPLIMYPFQFMGCKEKWEGALPWKYTFFGMCRVQVDSVWMPERNVVIRKIMKEDAK